MESKLLFLGIHCRMVKVNPSENVGGGTGSGCDDCVNKVVVEECNGVLFLAANLTFNEV